MPGVSETLLVIEPAPARRAKTLAIIAGAVAVVLVLGAGAYFGYRFLFGGAQPSERMPASTVAFLSVDLTPSAEQSTKLLQLLKKFPGHGGDASPAATIERLLEKLELKNLDVKRDITSWIGTRVAVGGWVDAAGDPYALVAISSEDDKAATAGLTRMRQNSGGELGFVVSDGYALIAGGADRSQAAADAAAAEAAKSPLSQEAKFVQARQWLADDQVALLYLDFDRIAKLTKTLTKALSESLMPSGEPFEDEMLGDEEIFGEMGDEFGKAFQGRVIAGARVEDDAVVVKSRTFGAKPDSAPGGSNTLARLGELPSDAEIAAVATLPEDLETSSMAAFAMPMAFSSLLFKPPLLTSAQEQELTELFAKEELTEAEEKRLEELLGGTGGQQSDAPFEALTQALSGATVAFAMKEVNGGSPVLQAAVALATAPSPERVKELTALSSDEVTVKVEGSTLTLGSPGFTVTGKLSGDPLFQRAAVGAPANLRLAIYADLKFVKAKTPLRAVIIMAGAEQGEQVSVARVLFG